MLLQGKRSHVQWAFESELVRIVVLHRGAMLTWALSHASATGMRNDEVAA